MKRALRDYHFIELHDNGNMSQFYKARSNKTNEIVAIKVEDIKKRDKQLIMNEIDILQSLNHNGIPKLIDWFQEDHIIYIILEFIEGENLLEKVKHSGFLSEKEVKNYVKELVEILKYLHDVKVIHRDVTAENIIIDPENHAHLVDFGIAVRIEDIKKSTPAGSPCYVAPEVVRNLPYSEKIDVWSLGVCIYAIILGNYPFYDKDRRKLLHLINFKTPIFPNSLSSNLKDLLQKMLTKNMFRRIDIFNVATHEWMESTD